MSLSMGDKLSLSHDHEVLTSIGWIPIANVTLEHKVACLKKGKYLVYENPVRTISYDYEGLM
jgi:hypothetical protein